jgi:SHAQKYF class myb-like DNA-binding protein
MLVLAESSVMAENRYRISMQSLLNDEELNEMYNISNINMFPTFQSRPSPTFEDTSSPSEEDEDLPQTTRRATNKRFRRGWTKDEHIKFLLGVFLFGRGNWKSISRIIAGKSPKQVQSHAQKYFLRQQQHTKTKRSIHDFNFSDLIQLLQDQTYRDSVRRFDTNLHKLLREFEQNYSEQKLELCLSNPGTDAKRIN